MSTPSYASEPQVQYLHQILEQIGRAELRIPDFQRPTRWKDEQRKRLLESVSGGYPIGGIMVWRTSMAIRHRTQIGGHPIPQGDGAAHQYLLDGFQRMSTLYAALRGDPSAPAAPDADGHRWALGYHLVQEEWVFMNEVDDADREVVLPGYALLESVALLRAQRNLMHRPDVETLLERSDALVRSVREYKLPVIPMVTDDLDEAVRTFGLLNTEGTRMSDLDLVAALTWQQDYDLRAQLDDAKEVLGRVGWEKLEERYVMGALRCAFDLALDTKERNAKVLGERLRNEPTVLRSTVEGLAAAGRFLADRCGVVSLDLVPYSYQAVLLGDVMRRHPTRSAELDMALEQWFWWTTAWSTFAGISGYRMNAMLSYLRALGDGEEVEWPWRTVDAGPAPLPSTTDPRSARTRAMTLQLFRAQGRPAALRQRLEAHAARALVRGLTGLPAKLARDPGNAFLVSFDDEQGLVNVLEAHRRGDAGAVFQRDATLRDHHQLSPQAWEALGRGDLGTFVRERRRSLEALEAAFLRELGLPPGARSAGHA
jgi:hypothetical protein